MNKQNKDFSDAFSKDNLVLNDLEILLQQLPDNYLSEDHLVNEGLLEVDLSKELAEAEESSFRKQPGIYAIYCLKNDYIYYGQSSNVSIRVSGHKYRLRTNQHNSKQLQKDWNKFGEDSFVFKLLYMGPEWEPEDKRLKVEKALIEKQLSKGKEAKCYNKYTSFSARIGAVNPFYGKQHTEESKERIGGQQRGVHKDVLGNKVRIEGNEYPSIAEAGRQLGKPPKTIRSRLNSPKFPNWILVEKAKWNAN